MESDHPTDRNDNQSIPCEDLSEPRHTHEADLVIPNPPEGGIVSEIPNAGPRTATSTTEYTRIVSPPRRALAAAPSETLAAPSSIPI